VADYTNTKPGIGDQFPQGGKETTWQRTEPLISPEKLKNRHLWGLSLVSGVKDPVTQKAAVMMPDMIADYIDQAVSTVEIETGLMLFSTEVEVKLPFDRQEYQSWGYLRLPHRPVASVEKITISPSSNFDVFNVPLDWVETGQLHHGQLNLAPLTIALTGNQSGVITTAGGPALIAILNNQQWVSSYWKLNYTVGFKDAMLPKPINDLIGITAAIDILSMLAATNSKSSSGSLSIDGMSQSQSNPGPDIYKPRLEDLEKKKDVLIRKLRALYGTRFFSGNV